MARAFKPLSQKHYDAFAPAVKSWFKFVTSAKRLDGVVGEWGSADRSRDFELQFAAPVVRLGPARRAPRRGVQGGPHFGLRQYAFLIEFCPMHLCRHTVA